MQLCFISILVALGDLVLARPGSFNHVVHEKRSGHSNWTPHNKLKPDGRTRLPVRIGLKQSNMKLGDQLLMNIADPTSKDYGQHMTTEQVQCPSALFVQSN